MTPIDDVIERLEHEALLADGGRPATLRRSNLMREAASLIKTLREAVEAEREECAKVCDAVAADIRTNPHDFGPIDAGGMRAAEKAGQFIRARSTQDKT